jgi:serine/threonine-protein kinase RsbW
VHERVSLARDWTLRADFAALAATARALRSELAAVGVDGETIHALDLALEELGSNAIRHGYDTTGAHELRVRLRVDADEVRLVLEDDARPFDPTVHPLPVVPASLADAPVGGRGIAMVRRLIADMRYQRGRTGNTLELVLPRRAR